MKDKNSEAVLVLIQIKELLILNLKRTLDNLETVNAEKIIKNEIKSQTTEIGVMKSILEDEKIL